MGNSQKRRFTAQMIERIGPPDAGRLELADAVTPGLVLRVTERGVKSFSVIYKVPGEGGVSAHGRALAGRQHRITLGRTPPLALKDARDRALAILQQATLGTDPRAERKQEHAVRHTNTVEAVKKRYVDQHAKPNLRNWKTLQSTLDLHVLPEWGNRPLRDIRRSDVHALLDAIVARGRVGTAREVRKYLSGMFVWALDREIVKENPVFKLKRDDLAKNEDAGRALANDELRAIWRGAGHMRYPYAPLYRLLMLTGQRRGEWSSAARSEIDAPKRWLEVPKARYKGKRDHIVPLMDAAWEIFEEMPAWVGNDYHLFSTRAGRIPVSGFSKAKDDLDSYAMTELREAAGDPEAQLRYFRIHDFRVTCETRLADLGFGQEIRDAVLGHAKVGLQKTYNKHDYLEQKREALGAYARHIIEVVTK